MLSLLHIENIAVIEQADISFGSGFNVLTGETGAGKSIVIDAISAILGERTYRDVIRTGAKSAFVSAIFSGVPQFEWFEENHVDYDSNELLIQREIFPDGRNTCKVNGRPVTVSILKKLGSLLINIHGQHDSQTLFDEETHLKYLDLFAKDQEQLEIYAQTFAKSEEKKIAMKRLSMDEGEKIQRQEMLLYQISEIEKAELVAGEEVELEARRKILQNAEKLTDALMRATACLYGDEDTDGAAALIANAEKAMSRITGYDDDLSEIHSRIEEVLYTVQDISEELRDRADALADSSDELDGIEKRMDVLHRLRRKYGADSAEILAYLEQAKEELDEIEFSDARMAQLEKDYKVLLSEAEKAAMSLRDVRQKAAVELERRLKEELAALDMPKAKFVCCFDEQPMSEDGMDRICFLMSANTGEAPKPMNKVASGGELARIMLAIKNVLAEQDQVSTMIFDEVDAGVSGRAAQKVAEKLRSVSKGKQVLCVTHLPQIAAVADTHLLISKFERDGRTYTQVTALDREGRKMEIARIIGGAEITQTTLKSAEEMIS